MEHEAKESAGVTRSQNAMYVLPHDASAAEEFLAPLLQRIEPAEEGLQLLVVTSDAETAARLSAAVLDDERHAGTRIVPVASTRRAARRVREGAHVVMGSARDLLALVQSSALKLDAVRGVCIAWADELVDEDVRAVEALFAEVPKTAARVIVATDATEQVEGLVERFARRPRRNVGRGEEEATPVDVAFVSTAAAGRPAALRRVIDALDPSAARVVVRGEESARQVRQALAAMGYGPADAAITVTYVEAIDDQPVALSILFDLPHTAGALARTAAGAERTVALVQPRQVASLRKLARGGVVSPIALPDVAARGEAEIAALRSALATEAAAGGIGRELLVLEPLLDEHDPVELAAAALRLMARATAGTGRTGSSQDAPSTGPTGPMTRLFVNVGEMDGARPGDLVGAIINEGGLQRDQVGRVEVRDKHAVVEVASSAAGQVIERLSGTSIRGRRVQAREDQDRPPRGEKRERPDRAPRERSFGDRDRPPRARSFGDRDRPPRERSFGERDRPPRDRGTGERSARPRPPRDRDDRGPGDRDRGPARPGRPFGDRDRGPRPAGPRGPARPPRPRRGDT